ncbi:P-loop containing nucleoside triphosphate hydrolase protein [Xylariaceae sp. FL0255]|nr:P-loop containing nucleoside triphosphate hydrolase protein [Xylariaceae sp. FL0255]
MGQSYSSSQLGKTLKVIRAGLPRTCPASFAQALEILLDGPVYHGGTQVTQGPEADIKTWIEVLQNLKLIKSRLDGFVAVADSPCCSMVPELMRLYPEAKVVCTVRDVAKWEKSMEAVSWGSDIMVSKRCSVPGAVDAIFCRLYRQAEASVDDYVWRRGTSDEKGGWEPLCQALDLPIPSGVAFPHINDSDAIEALAKKQISRGIKRWIEMFTLFGLVVYSLSLFLS